MTTSTTRLNLRKIQQLAGHAVRNGICLHFESLALYESKCYPTAFFISVLAMEEIGKVFAADHFAWNYGIHRRGTSAQEHKWLTSLLSDHRKKQLAFLRQALASVEDIWATFDMVGSRQLDIDKQNAMDVGLEKPCAGDRTNGKFILPETSVKRRQAKEQINHIHRFLLEETRGTFDGRLWHDLPLLSSDSSDICAKG
jgi:AbiV family abortive infection protein